MRSGWSRGRERRWCARGGVVVSGVSVCDVSALRRFCAFLLHPHAYLRRSSRAARMFARQPRLNGSYEGVDVKVEMRPERYLQRCQLKLVLHLPLRLVYVSSRGLALGSQSRRIPRVLALACASLSEQGARTRAVPIEQSRGVLVCIGSTCHVVLFVFPVSRHLVIRNSESRLYSIED